MAKSAPGGRPTIYNKKLAHRICDSIASTSLGLKKLCQQNEWMPDRSTVFAWRSQKEEFSDLYTKAKQKQVDFLAEECLDIADDVENDTIINDKGNPVCNSEYVNRSRLRVDTRKWYVSKIAPRIYGDARRVEELEGQNDSLREELRELRTNLDSKNKKEY